MDNQGNNYNNPPSENQSSQPPPQYPPPQYPPPQYPPPQYPPPQYPQNTRNMPGRGKAIASLVLGISSIVFTYIPIFGLAAGIVGLILASMSKREGFVGGIRTGGFVCSLIGVIFGAFWTVLILLIPAIVFSVIAPYFDVGFWDMHW